MTSWPPRGIARQAGSVAATCCGGSDQRGVRHGQRGGDNSGCAANRQQTYTRRDGLCAFARGPLAIALAATLSNTTEHGIERRCAQARARAVRRQRARSRSCFQRALRPGADVRVWISRRWHRWSIRRRSGLHGTFESPARGTRHLPRRRNAAARDRRWPQSEAHATMRRCARGAAPCARTWRRMRQPAVGVASVPRVRARGAPRGRAQRDKGWPLRQTSVGERRMAAPRAARRAPPSAPPPPLGAQLSYGATPCGGARGLGARSAACASAGLAKVEVRAGAHLS